MEGKPRHRSLFHIPSVEFQQTLEVVAGFECTVFLLRWLEEQTGKGTGEALRTILCPLARASPENDTLCKITFDTVVYAAQKTLRCRFLNAFERQSPLKRRSACLRHGVLRIHWSANVRVDTSMRSGACRKRWATDTTGTPRRSPPPLESTQVSRLIFSFAGLSTTSGCSLGR